MERRYLIATLALVATFAIFSREFRAGRFDKLPASRAELMAGLNCARHAVARQLLASLGPLVDRPAPEHAQIVAEMNLPEAVRLAPSEVQAQVQAVRQAAQAQCDAAMRAQLAKREAGERALRIRIQAVDRAQRMQDLTVIRAEELRERAGEQAQSLDWTVSRRVQEQVARSLEQALGAMEKPRVKLVPLPAKPPIHINFTLPPRSVIVTVPASPEVPSATF